MRAGTALHVWQQCPNWSSTQDGVDTVVLCNDYTRVAVSVPTCRQLQHFEGLVLLPPIRAYADHVWPLKRARECTIMGDVDAMLLAYENESEAHLISPLAPSMLSMCSSSRFK